MNSFNDIIKPNPDFRKWRGWHHLQLLVKDKVNLRMEPMIYKIFKNLDSIFSFAVAKAHCDIPCKIYDPIEAQLGCLTIIRLNDLLEELQNKDLNDFTAKGQISRLIAQKEEHGVKVKEAIRVIWGDYFKQPQIEQFPEIHDLVHKIMMQASKAKQNVDRQAGVDLLDQVNKFAEIFWKTKNVSTYTATSPYPPNQEVVYPDLKS